MMNRARDPEAHPSGPIPPAIDDDGMLPLVCGYVDGLPSRVAAMKAALLDREPARLIDLAHQTKGVGAMYGYPCLTETAALIEDAAREGRDDDLIAELIDEFQALTARVGLGLRRRD